MGTPPLVAFTRLAVMIPVTRGTANLPNKR